MKLLDGVRAESVTSEDGQYRYRLERTWDTSRLHLVWIGLHPTKAAADEDDRYLRKLQGFARRWKWGGIIVVNLFALRCRDYYGINQHPAPVGAHNDEHLLFACRDVRTKAVICGWGNRGRLYGRADQVTRLLRDREVPLWRMAGPLTRFGQPWVPTRFPLDALPVPFDSEVAP